MKIASLASMTVAPVMVQTSPSNEINRIINEGMRLFREGSGESLRNAIGQFKKALRLARSANAQDKQALSLLTLGRIPNRLGEKQKALEYYNRALPLRRAVGDRSDESTTLNNIRLVYDSLGEKKKALEYYNQALSLSRALGSRSGEAAILNNIGSVLTAQNQPQLAIVFYKKSVTSYETLRQDIRTLPKETQQTYTKSVELPDRVPADLLLKNDRILEAQQVLDLLKVQELNLSTRQNRMACNSCVVGCSSWNMASLI